MGYAAFTAAMAVARFGGDALRARYSERNLLRASAGLSAVAMAVVLASGNAVVSIVGYALVGAGLAPVVPILFNAATRVPGTSRAAAIAAVSSIGYAGFMIGPPLIGGLAQAALADGGDVGRGARLGAAGDRRAQGGLSARGPPETMGLARHCTLCADIKGSACTLDALRRREPPGTRRRCRAGSRRRPMSAL